MSIHHEPVRNSPARVEKSTDMVCGLLKKLMGNERRRLRRQLPGLLADVRANFPDAFFGECPNWMGINAMDDGRYSTLVSALEALRHQVASRSP